MFDFGIGGIAWAIIKGLGCLWLFLWAKKYIVLGIIILLVGMAAKTALNLMNFLAVLLASKAARLILGAMVVFGLGFGTHMYLGWGHSSSMPVVKEIGVKKQNKMLRSHALIYKGETYYKSSFVNKLLEKSGVNDSVKSLG